MLFHVPDIKYSESNLPPSLKAFIGHPAGDFRQFSPRFTVGRGNPRKDGETHVRYMDSPSFFCLFIFEAGLPGQKGGNKYA